MIDQKLLDIICCPACKNDLEYMLENNSNEREELICRNCKICYPIKDNIPLLLQNKSKKIE